MASATVINNNTISNTISIVPSTQVNLDSFICKQCQPPKIIWQERIIQGEPIKKVKRSLNSHNYYAHNTNNPNVKLDILNKKKQKREATNHRNDTSNTSNINNTNNNNNTQVVVQTNNSESSNSNPTDINPPTNNNTIVNPDDNTIVNEDIDQANNVENNHDKHYSEIDNNSDHINSNSSSTNKNYNNGKTVTLNPDTTFHNSNTSNLNTQDDIWFNNLNSNNSKDNKEKEYKVNDTILDMSHPSTTRISITTFTAESIFYEPIVIKHLQMNPLIIVNKHPIRDPHSGANHNSYVNIEKIATTPFESYQMVLKNVVFQTASLANPFSETFDKLISRQPEQVITDETSFTKQLLSNPQITYKSTYFKDVDLKSFAYLPPPSKSSQVHAFNSWMLCKPYMLNHVNESSKSFFSIKDMNIEFHGVQTPYGYLKNGNNFFCIHIEQLILPFIHYQVTGKSKWYAISYEHKDKLFQYLNLLVTERAQLDSYFLNQLARENINEATFSQMLQLLQNTEPEQLLAYFYAKNIFPDANDIRTRARIPVHELILDAGETLVGNGNTFHWGRNAYDVSIGIAINYFPEQWFVDGPTYLVEYLERIQSIYTQWKKFKKLESSYPLFQTVQYNMDTTSANFTTISKQNQDTLFRKALFLFQSNVFHEDHIKVMLNNVPHGLTCRTITTAIQRLKLKQPNPNEFQFADPDIFSNPHNKSLIVDTLEVAKRLLHEVKPFYKMYYEEKYCCDCTHKRK